MYLHNERYLFIMFFEMILSYKNVDKLLCILFF